MGLSQACAIGFAVLAGFVVLFPLALIAGAPLGHLTQGGARDGPLAAGARAGAAVSALLQVLMALAILSAAGIGPDWPRWTAWAALGLTAVTMVLTAITPSPAERRLWLPVTVTMTVSALVAIFG